MQWYEILSFFFQAEDGIRDYKVTGVQTCALPISRAPSKISYRKNAWHWPAAADPAPARAALVLALCGRGSFELLGGSAVDRKSTRLNSSHLVISYAVFCLKKKKTTSSLITPIVLR